MRRAVLTAWREGQTLEAAARDAGVSTGCARRWVVKVGGVIPGQWPQSSGRYLSFEEREVLSLLRAGGSSQAEIARVLGRSPSTISREVARNKHASTVSPAPLADGTRRRNGPVPGVLGQLTAAQRQLRRVVYTASNAHAKAEVRARRPKPSRLGSDPLLRARVQAGLRLRWSPEQISRRLAERYPDRPEMHVSHETIYQALYVQGRGELRRELTRCLRTGRALRLPQRQAERRRSRPHIGPELLISERPAEVEDRAVPGHWEGDLITGKDNGSAIGTLVERTTRYCLLLHLPARADGVAGHGAEAVRDAMLTQIATLPTLFRKTITWDQGVELARHRDFTVATGMDVYFCDPHSPWQRGTNENTNGLLRQYFPKGTDLSRHSREDLDHVAAQLNGRPRKTLAWQTPRERLTQLLSEASQAGVATTT